MSQPNAASGWRSMSSAPMDGTIILVTETANGETFQVLPAAFMNHGGGLPQFGEKKIGSIGVVGGRCLTPHRRGWKLSSSGDLATSGLNPGLLDADA